MDFSDNKEQAAFRQEVRDFIKTEVKSGEQSDDMERGMYRGAFERLRDLRGKLSKRGWIAPAWPKEYGGAGLDVMRQFIMNEEFASNRVPPVGGMGVSMVGPTLIVHGNEEQKKEHLGRILNGEVQWCQGFSEPGSGSDLASLQTRAVRDGDDFVINGQKIWTSGAQYAHWMFMMARTDPDAPKHKGISYFLVDMKSPGITVRPLTNLANQNMFNEVFFEDVRVPARNLVGELNRGWYIGTTTLDFERSSIGSAVGIRLQLDGLVEYAKRHEKDGTSRTAQISSLKTELADRYVEANVARLMSYRVVTMQAKGMVPNHEASMTKLFASELNQRIARTGMKVLGLYGQLFGDDAPMKGRYESSYMTSLSSTIAGGTSEIQRNIIATRGLGLPRD
jgi:alkylation response protein AidB-like acyl-CoA dehydrogenase